MKRIYKYLALSSVSVFALLAACLYINNYDINQPQDDGTMQPRIKVGQTATFTLNGNFASIQDSETDTRFVVAVLAPRAWDMANKTTVSFHGGSMYDPLEEQSMSIIPSTASPSQFPGYTWPEALMQKYGIGNNKYNDMEWVAWWADTPCPYTNGSKSTYTVTIKSNVGDDNLIAYLGFFVGHSARGMQDDLSTNHYDQSFPAETFTVYGGPGETIDYTKTRFNMIEPMRSLQDDLITFTFAGETNVNDLINCNEIYFEATAYTVEGHSYPVTERSDKTLMKRPDTFTHDYSIMIWPAGFFNIPEGETIDYIEYSFTNADGTVKVNKSYDMKVNGDTPANDNIPFTYNMVCGVN